MPQEARAHDGNKAMSEPLLSDEYDPSVDRSDFQLESRGADGAFGLGREVTGGGPSGRGSSIARRR